MGDICNFYTGHSLTILLTAGMRTWGQTMLDHEGEDNITGLWTCKPSNPGPDGQRFCSQVLTPEAQTSILVKLLLCLLSSYSCQSLLHNEFRMQSALRSHELYMGGLTQHGLKIVKEKKYLY